MDTLIEVRKELEKETSCSLKGYQCLLCGRLTLIDMSLLLENYNIKRLCCDCYLKELKDEN